MIYLISLPNHKKHQNISGNSLMSEKIYSRYLTLNEEHEDLIVVGSRAHLEKVEYGFIAN